VHATTGDFDEEQHVQPPEPDLSTVKQSTAITVFACACRNSRHDGPLRLPAGSSCAWRRIFFTVVADTMTPKPFRSPTMRT
jgi:hypothetical protein